MMEHNLADPRRAGLCVDEINRAFVLQRFHERKKERAVDTRYPRKRRRIAMRLIAAIWADMSAIRFFKHLHLRYLIAEFLKILLASAPLFMLTLSTVKEKWLQSFIG